VPLRKFVTVPGGFRHLVPGARQIPGSSAPLSPLSGFSIHRFRAVLNGVSDCRLGPPRNVLLRMWGVAVP
jgi:hypothetical protein